MGAFVSADILVEGWEGDILDLGGWICTVPLPSPRRKGCRRTYIVVVRG